MFFFSVSRRSRSIRVHKQSSDTLSSQTLSGLLPRHRRPQRDRQRPIWRLSHNKRPIPQRSRRHDTNLPLLTDIHQTGRSLPPTSHRAAVRRRRPVRRPDRLGRPSVQSHSRRLHGLR